MDWDELQSDVVAWATKNFGDNPIWQPMLGLVEEVGEYFVAINNGGSRSEMEDALGDQCVYALNLCEKAGISFSEDIATKEDRKYIKPDELLVALALSSRAILKNAQGIRNFTWETRRDYLRLHLGFWYQWACWEAISHSMPSLLTITRQVWAEVRKRDWVKNPGTAAVL